MFRLLFSDAEIAAAGERLEYEKKISRTSKYLVIEV